MDLSRMLSSEKRDDLSPAISPMVSAPTAPKRARLDPTAQHHIDPHHRPQPQAQQLQPSVAFPLPRHPTQSLSVPMYPRGAHVPPPHQHPSSSQPLQSSRPADIPSSAGHDASNTSSRAARADSPYAELQTALYAALENNAAMLTTGDKLTLALEVLRARQLEADLVQARSNIKNIVTRSGPSPITLRAVIPSVARAGVPVGTPLDIGGKILLSPANNDPQSLLLTLELHNVRAAQQQPHAVPHPQTDVPRYASPAAAGASSTGMATSSGADNGANGHETTGGAPSSQFGAPPGLGTGMGAAMGANTMGPGSNKEASSSKREEISANDNNPPAHSGSSSGAGAAVGNPGRGV